MKNNLFKSADSEIILKYIKEKYDVEPEFLWEKSPENAVFRHKKTLKWFGALLVAKKKSLDIDGEGSAEILDLKCDPILIGTLIDGKRYLPGYHMNKEHWITLVLDSSIPTYEIFDLIDMSFELTEK